MMVAIAKWFGKWSLVGSEDGVWEGDEVEWRVAWRQAGEE